MDIKTGLATASLLAMSNLPSSAQIRNWLPLPDAKLPVAADVLTFTDPSMNYGPRARVRIYRPDGVYDIDNTPLQAPAAAETGSEGGTKEH